MTCLSSSGQKKIIRFVKVFRLASLYAVVGAGETRPNLRRVLNVSLFSLLTRAEPMNTTWGSSSPLRTIILGRVNHTTATAMPLSMTVSPLTSAEINECGYKDELLVLCRGRSVQYKKSSSRYIDSIAAAALPVP